MSLLDPAVFIWNANPRNVVTGIIACHVDDFLWGGDDNFGRTVITQVRKTFTIGQEEETTFKYVGMHMSCKDSEILLHQCAYADSLEFIPISKERCS